MTETIRKAADNVSAAMARRREHEAAGSGAKAEDAATRALALVGLPASRDVSVEGLGAAGLKKLELAKALATAPKLLLADESLGGLDHAEMEHAAEMLEHIRSKLNITIIWVEHIMGVLMRVVDRVIVLDHGEVVEEGTHESLTRRKDGLYARLAKLQFDAAITAANDSGKSAARMSG